VGGDYYDFLDIADHMMGFVLADISGKGVPAALLMANLQATFRNQPPGTLLRPGDALKAINHHFYEATEAERFATLFFGAYDDRTRKLRYVNCGHVAPLLLRASGKVERLGATALMLGAFEAWNCREGQTEIAPNDVMVLYSDGVTEAGIEHGEEFGEERLVRTLQEQQGRSALGIVQKVLEAVADHSGGARSDDVTVVALRGIT
jgi:serine phosphatase RsbU (regulator of sigma subunit)